jgi:hypothetical protein
MRILSILLLAIVLAAPAMAGSPTDFLFVTTTDFSTGSTSCIDLNTKAATNDIQLIHSDASVAYWHGLIYVVNRLGQDNITRLDPGTGFGLVNQFSTGNGSNPHDIACTDGSTGYVTRYETNALWKMNTNTGAMTASIDFSAMADADGICEMDNTALVGERLFVSVQRLDRNNFFGPTGTSYLAVVDVNTDTLIDTDAGTSGTQPITLTNPNPFSSIQLDPYSGNLYLSCVGFFGLIDAGLEMVDPNTMQSLGVIFSESAAGGDILDAEIVSPTLGWAIVATPSFITQLITFDPSTGTKLSTIYSPGGYDLQDVERAPTGEIFLADRTVLNPGVRCYNAFTGTEITASPISTGLPPFDLTFSVPVRTGADTPRAGTALGPNYPNPFNPTTTIPWSVTNPGHVALRIYDARGTLVHTLVDASTQAGQFEAGWNGRDTNGRPVGSGVYFARLVTSDGTAVRKLVLLK